MIESTERTAGVGTPLAAAPAVGGRRRLERAGMIGAIVVVYGLLAVMLVFVMPGLFGFKTYTGIGGSMGDTIPDGSMIVTRSVDSEDVEVGDVIAFRWPGFEHPITHRVVEVDSRNGTPIFTTKGDGNVWQDPFQASGDQQIREVVYTAPRIGTYLPVARSLVYVLAFAGGFILWRRHRQRRLALMREMSEARRRSRGDDTTAPATVDRDPT